MLTDEQILSKAETLAQRAASAGVHEDQLSFAFAHLKRHQSVAATLQLLSELLKSSFSKRSSQTPVQFKALEENVRAALQGVSSWQEGASIVGWARRLLKFYRPDGNPPAAPNRGWR